MTTVNDLHLRAMDLADEAFRFRKSRANDKAQGLFLQALRLEMKAASLLPPVEDSEPSRSILYRSASSLAFNAGDYDTAEKLVVQGLIGFPPQEIKEELKTLYKKITQKRHLQKEVTTVMNTQEGVNYGQDQINHGQARINYEFVQANLQVIEALKSIVETLKVITAVTTLAPTLRKIDFGPMEAALMAAYNTSSRVPEVRPPGCEAPYSN